MSPIAGLRRLLRHGHVAARSATVLIDGPSGSGKSRLADAALAAWPRVQLVRLDDLYPGWRGLEAGAEAVVSRLLRPRAHGNAARFRRWDWAADRPGEEVWLAPGHPLLIEGCGALSRAAAEFASLAVWVSAPDDVRRERALARDAGGFDEHWEMWDEQWHRFTAREHPRRLADVVIDGR